MYSIINSNNVNLSNPDDYVIRVSKNKDAVIEIRDNRGISNKISNFIGRFIFSGNWTYKTSNVHRTILTVAGNSPGLSEIKKWTNIRLQADKNSYIISHLFDKNVMKIHDMELTPVPSPKVSTPDPQPESPTLTQKPTSTPSKPKEPLDPLKNNIAADSPIKPALSPLIVVPVGGTSNHSPSHSIKLDPKEVPQIVVQTPVKPLITGTFQPKEPEPITIPPKSPAKPNNSSTSEEPAYDDPNTHSSSEEPSTEPPLVSANSKNQSNDDIGPKLSQSPKSPSISQPIPNNSQSAPILQPTAPVIEPKIPSVTAQPSGINVLPDVPKDGIKVGLPNITDTNTFGNTCWLNSILKFISSTDFFDEMLTKKSNDPAVRKAQADMLNVITMLRTGKKLTEPSKLSRIYNYVPGYKKDDTPHEQNITSITDDDYKSLLRSLKQLKRFNGDPLLNPRDLGSQQEAFEYLQAILAAFEWGQINPPKIVDTFEPNDPQFAPTDFPKPATRDVPQSCIPISLNANHLASKEPLDLATLIRDQGVREIRLNPDHGKDALRIDWKVTSEFTNLPDTLIVFVGRNVLNNMGYYDKVHNPIKVDDSGLITLTESRPQSTETGEIFNYLPYKKCYYQIESAVVHSGSASGGHYICHERTADKKAFQHSDTSIQPINLGVDFGTQGNIFRLKRVKEELIPNSNPEHFTTDVK